MVKRRRRARTSNGYAYLGTAARLKASRRRSIRRAMAAAGAVLILAGAVYGADLLLDWAAGSDVFMLKRIRVLGNRHLDAPAVAAAAGIDSGTNILRVRPNEVEQSVSALPLVKRAFVQRRLPDELVIRVAERRPCFLVNCGCLWLVDREGVVIGRGNAGDMNRFTMATGFFRSEERILGEGPGPSRDTVVGSDASAGASAEHGEGEPRADSVCLEPGARLDSRSVGIVIETIRAMEKDAPDLCRMVSEICLTRDGGLVLFTSDPPHCVTLGRERPSPESLVALGPVLGDLRRRGLVGMEVDLRFGRQLVVRASEGHPNVREES